MKIQLMSMCALMMNLSYASHRDYRDYYKATTSQMPKELKEGTPAYRQAYLTLLNQKIQAAEREKRLSTAVDTKQGDAKKDTTVSRLRTLLSDHLLADLLSIILCYAGIWEQHDLSHHYHDKEITSVSRATLSPDGQLVAAICDSNNYIPTVWNSSTGNVLYRVYGLHEPLHCAFSPDSSLLATSGDDVDCGEIDLWDVKTGAHLRQSDRTPGDLIRVRFSNNGQCLVSFGDHDGEEVRLWNVQDGKMSKGLALNGAKNNNADHMAGAFRMNEDVLFTHDDAHLVTSNNHGFIEVWDVTSGKRAWSRLHHASHEHERYLFSERRSTLLDYYAIALAASNNGSRLASAGRDGRICIWQQSDGTCERIIPFPYDSKEDETRLSFSHDDAILIGATNGKHIRLWDVATGNLFEEQTCEQVERFAKGFSATDARSIKIASAYNGAGKGTIRIRELAR